MTTLIDPPAAGTPGSTRVRAQLSATERLVAVAQELSMARDLDAITAIVRHAARELTGADGATIVLREGDLCFYADEEAVGPLWKGRRFPMSACISGWAMLQREAAVIEDIYADERIPHDAYRPTFVASLAMVPIRTVAPVGAIGNYWAERHRATEGEVKLLRALADLTSVAMENVQLYAALQERLRQVQEALELRNEFISIAAHELRTPLTAMLLQLQRLQELSSAPAPDPRRLTESATRSVAAAQRFATLVDGLLDASRLEHGRLPLNLEQFDLREVASELLKRFEPAARQARSELTFVASSPVPGRWDRLRIEQVLSSLVSNALKFGAGKPIRVSLDAGRATAHIQVQDHGPGIAPDIAGKIFERFGRAGPINHYAGLGLGLYLAREVIEAHGGGIRFESSPGDGCTFFIDLPTSPEHGAQALPVRPQGTPSTPSPPGGPAGE